MSMCDVLYCPIFFSLKRSDLRIIRVRGDSVGSEWRGPVDGIWRQVFHTPQALAFRSVAVYALPCPGPIFTTRRLIGGYSPRGDG